MFFVNLVLEITLNMIYKWLNLFPFPLLSKNSNSSNRLENISFFNWLFYVLVSERILLRLLIDCLLKFYVENDLVHGSVMPSLVVSLVLLAYHTMVSACHFWDPLQ